MGFSLDTYAVHFIATVSQGNIAISPTTVDYYEGEKRVLPVGNKLFAFYYNNSDTIYKTSTNGGFTWSPATSAGTGAISSDFLSWTSVAAKTHDSINHIVLLYFTSSGSNSTFYAKRGNITGTSIIWNSPTALFTSANPPDCAINIGGGACAAAVGSTDSKGNIYAAFRWATPISYHYEILESTDGGSKWKVSLNDTDTNGGSRNVMALAKLAKDKMLFVNAPFEKNEFDYRIFDGKSWSSVYTTSGSGLSVGVKQISSASNSSGYAFVTFVSGGSSGALKMGVWNNSTGLWESFETADSSLSHSLPSITTTTTGVIHIFSLSGGKVYDTIKTAGSWKLPANPFGTAFNLSNQLTSSISNPSAIWMESSSPSFSLKFG